MAANVAGILVLDIPLDYFCGQCFVCFSVTSVFARVRYLNQPFADSAIPTFQALSQVAVCCQLCLTTCIFLYADVQVPFCGCHGNQCCFQIGTWMHLDALVNSV